jgi:hypothetical protein
MFLLFSLQPDFEYTSGLPSPKSNMYVFHRPFRLKFRRSMCRVFDILGHLRFDWLCNPIRVWSVQFTHESNTCMEPDMHSVGLGYGTVAELLDSTHGPYVVSLHTQRSDKQRWQGVWKSQYVKERILIWVICICFWHSRDPPTCEQKQIRIQAQIATERSDDKYSQIKTQHSDLIWGRWEGTHRRRSKDKC